MNKLILCCITVLSFFSCQPKGEFESLGVVEFADLLQKENVQCLDVRTLAEYTEGHIAKSIHINVMDATFDARVDSLLLKEEPIAVYCRSGRRSKKAAAALSKKGFQVYELEKGFQSWQAAGKEIEK